jgi:RNA polymerase sigma factor (sigma-70 family)
MPDQTTASGSMPHSAELAALYLELARQLLALLRREVQAPEAMLEEACQFAWSRLAPRFATVDRERALAWLRVTARRELLRALRRSRRERSLEGLLEEHGDDGLFSLRCERTQAGEHDERDAVADLVERRERLRCVGSLPARQQQALMLHAAGFSYEEIARRTGDSRRTVERQLSRARRRVRGLAA